MVLQCELDTCGASMALQCKWNTYGATQYMAPYFAIGCSVWGSEAGTEKCWRQDITFKDAKGILHRQWIFIM
eukprot:250215-Karenia_brevis.AAC.1